MKSEFKTGQTAFIYYHNNKITITIKRVYFDYIYNSFVYICDEWKKPLLEEYLFSK